jgi:RraA family protein
MVGSAYTIRTSPGDNLALLAALEQRGTGRVLVIDAGGHDRNAILGELLCRLAKKRGFTGVVVDGAIRDLDAIPDTGLAVFARTVSPNGPYKNGPGALNVPICACGVVVQDGDLIVGDRDGVVSIEQDHVAKVLSRAAHQLKRETHTRLLIDSNRWHPFNDVTASEPKTSSTERP